MGNVAPPFGPQSMMWRIARENFLVFGGPRALLLQLAHPKVAAGVADPAGSARTSSPPSSAFTGRAAWMADRGLPMAAEASMAKVVAGRAAASIPQRCAALAGPLGVRVRDRFERLVRDAKIVDIFEGTGQINTLIVARRVLGYSREQLK